MIRNIEFLMKRLAELSEVINRYHSETTQLRVLELLLGKSLEIETEESDTDSKR